MLLNYCLIFSETWRYINISIPINGVLNCLSTQLFPRIFFFFYLEKHQEVSTSVKVACKGVADAFMKLN